MVPGTLLPPRQWWWTATTTKIKFQVMVVVVVLSLANILVLFVPGTNLPEQRPSSQSKQDAFYSVIFNDTQTTHLINMTCHHDPVMDMFQVAKSTQQQPQQQQQQSSIGSIWCLIFTKAEHHATRVEAIQQTWGPQCEKVLFASTARDATIGARQYSKKHETENEFYNASQGLYDRMGYALKHIVTSTTSTSSPKTTAATAPEQKQQPYEWILVAEDDTYIIMENLKQFLLDEQIKHGVAKLQQEPMVYGRIVDWPVTLNDYRREQWFTTKVNVKFLAQLKERYPLTTWRTTSGSYAYGGSGILLNRVVVETFANAYSGVHEYRKRGFTPPDPILVPSVPVTTDATDAAAGMVAAEQQPLSPPREILRGLVNGYVRYVITYC
jgi:hypothetical protein